MADNTAVVAEEQAQEPEVQVEESASPAVQESAPAAETPAEPAAQAVAETPAEPAAQAVAETPAEPAAQAVAETPAEPAAQAVAETPAEPAAQAVAEKPAEPAAQEVVETPEKPAGQTVAEKPAEPTGQTVAETPEPAQNNSQEESKPEEQPAASDSGENKDQTNVENGAENSQESQPSEEAKEILYHVTFDEHAADFGKIQVRGEGAPVENISSYRKEVKENESFAFSVKANDGYEVDHVCFADTQADIQKNADGLYEILAVTKDEKVTVTYKAVAQEPVAEPPAAENNIALLMLDETDHEQNVITYYEVVFKYEDKDGTFHTLTTQQIESGKAAVAPAAPEKDGYRFIGWDKDFSNVTADMEVTAQYSEIGAKVKYQIIYQYTDGTVAAQPWVAEFEKGVTYENTITSPELEGFSVDQPTVTFSGKVETDQTITVTYTGTATTYTVKHLLQNTDGKTYTEDASETINGTTGTTTVAAARAYKGFTAQEVNQAKVNADGSTVVEIKYDRNSYRFTWNTDGGSYVEPSDILYDASITLPKEPTKLGYTFKGWDNCPATMPAEDTTVTAKWEINTRAAYRIIYWQESLETPGTYEMAKNKNGEADIVAGTDVVGKNISYSVEKNRYEGFEPAVEKNKGDIQVTADGLAVKNIYYNRKTYTIKFYVSQRRDYFGNPTDWKADNNLEISARYGEDVSDQWNDEKHSDKIWATTSKGGTYYTNFSNMPAKNISMYGFVKESGVDIVYYIETLDGKIKEYQSYDIKYVRLTSEDAQPINGFSFDMNDALNYGWYRNNNNYVKDVSYFADKVTGETRYGGFLYYSRNSYVLHFANCTGVADASIKFEANVSGYKPLDKDVQPPANVDRDYIFAGWYTSPACEDGTEFDWQTKMPSHTITLYAKWEAPTYTVTFNPNGGTVTESTLTVTKGQTLGDTLPTPTKEGDEFLGWYTDESFTHKFVKESQIVKDQTLYAKWKSSDIITYYIVAKDVDGKELWRSEAQSIEKGKNASVNAQPIDAYYPQELSKSVIINNDKQEIVFIYKPLESWTYTIRYVDESGKEIGTAESVTTTDNMKTVVYKVFEGYQLTSPAVVQAIKGQTTEIVFTYVAPEATYTVEHWLQNPDGTYYKKEFELQGAEKIGAWVSATPKGYTGFTCVSGEIERSGAVVKGGGLVLKVYYNRESLSVKDYTGKYDGQEHTITITAPGIEGDVIQYQIGDGQWTDLNDNFTNLPKYKDCGTTVIKVRVVNNGNVGPAVEAKISITQRKITLTSAKDEKFYDGTPLTNDTIVVGGEDEFVEGEGIASYGVTGSQTEAGESDNVFDYTLKENTKSENYEIQKKYGKLKVKPVDTEVVVTITEHSGTGIYDGNKQTVTGYDVTNISNTLYSEKDFSFNGNAVIEGTNAGSYNMELKAANFKNISKNFTNVKFVIVDGTLEIARCPVTIKAKESSKVYGNPDPAFELAILENSVGDELKDLDLAVIRSDAGDDTIKVHENVLSIQNSKEALEKEYTNYTFTIIPADFTIFENENGLTVSAADVVKEYDGNSYGVTATARIKNAEIENPNITVKYWNEKTNAYDLDKSPEYRNVADTPAVVKFEASLYGYKSVQGEATVTINKRSVLLTSASASKIYDGTPLTNSNVTVTGSGFVDGEVTDIKAIGRVTNVADSPKPNTITFTPVEGKFNADNYAIEQVEGELAITPVTTKVKVEIIGNHVSEKYDGTPKVAEGYVINIVEDTSGVYQKDDIEVIGNDSAFAERTDAGTTFMGLKADAFANGNPNFTNITIVVTDGYVEVIPRSVTLTSESAAKVYDGTPLIRPDVTIGGDGFVNGEVSDVKAIGSALNVSDKDVRNEITFTQKTGYKAENYDIKYEPGTLRITPIVDEVTITITEHSASLKYNGAEQSVTGYDTAIDNTLYKETDFTFSGDATAKGTDFGSYPMNLKAEDFTNKNKNFANVVFEIVDGQLEITKRDVELISGSDEKVYDGTPLTKNHILIAGDQFVPGEGADYDVTGSQTNAGSSDNEFTYRLNSSTKAINYNIKTTPGTLKVTPVTDNVIVTITEHSGSAKYDGTEKTVTGYDVAIDNELYTENDFTFSGNDVIKATDADIYNMELKPSDFNNISHNFASVTFKIVDGTLNISRRDVTLTSATDSKTYDGKPLTNDNVAVGGDGFAEGEGAVYNVTGSQTEAGFSNNTFSYELKDNTKTDNYNITSFEGILTVSSSEDEVVVTITGNKDTQKYDGTEKTVEGYTVSITSPLYKESDFTFDGTALVKGTNADTYMMGLSEENFTNTNKNFAKVTFHVIDGSLVIEKRNLVLTSASAQKVYNGTELTAKDVTVSGDGFVKGEGASYDVTGTQTTVGDSENTFTYKLNENTNADNYTIETKNGSLLVTPVTDQVVVTLKENSGTEVYDGTEKTVTGYTVADISNKLYTDKDFTFTGNAEVKGTDAGIYDMELKAEDFQNINPNFTNVVFKVEDGALEITRRQVTFQADSGEKKYDGEELTVPTWKLEDGTLADGQQEIAHVEGSQTLVGESENKITDLKIFVNAASQETEGSETEAQDVTKNYSIILLAGLLKVTDGSEEDPVDPGQVVTKTHEDKTYDLDETVTFTINVKNIYDEAKNVRIIELPGVVIEGAPQETPNVLTVEKVPAGETVTATATYKITEADIANGSFVNTVKVEFEGGKPFENTDTVTTVDPVRSYTLTKKSSESIHENGMFKAGETIHYTLTVTNTGNQTLENVEITDTLNAAGTISNIQGADSKQDGKVTIFTISSLAPKAEATITYDYVVQEADKGNTISNAAVGTPANPEDPDGEKPGDNTDNPVENPKLEVKKDIVSITAADGTQKDKAGKADLNDIITYSVTVTNTGNVKLTNVKITDSLEGIQLAEGQSFDLGILEAGKAKTVTYTYQVKESDLGKSILNTATATGDVPENPADTPKPEGKDEKEVPTEDPANCSITVTKRLTNIQGELLAVRAADFYVTLFSDEAMTQKAADTKMIHFDENQGTSSVTFDQLKRGTYYVAETDAEGKVVAEGTYNNGSYVAQYQAGNKVEITENGTAAQFQFDNQFLLLPDEYYIVKTITINKTVVKKNGEDLKSEETFYAGIFKDEDCTQLADGVSQNIVPLVMDGESTATAKTEVTVPVGGEEIKLYVTEVTADGTPVALNDIFEYDVEINDGFVTLSETSEDATVLIINTSRKEEPEPTAEPAQEPTEAPAAHPGSSDHTAARGQGSYNKWRQDR
ncbi:MAG: InlB B-repeat-containing protein [Blautia faecis]